jgi:hypothetical protein
MSDMKALEILPYRYPTTNSELIKSHHLEKHFEGGYFTQTVILTSQSPPSPTTSLPISEALKGKSQVSYGPGLAITDANPKGFEAIPKGAEVDASLIYYLLTPDSYRGRMHMNLHSVSTSL